LPSPSRASASSPSQLRSNRIVASPIKGSTAASAMPLYPNEARRVAEIFGDDAPDLLRVWDSAVAVLEREGLPKRDPLFGNRRYWPAVEAFLRRRAGLRPEAPSYAPDGVEDWS